MLELLALPGFNHHRRPFSVLALNESEQVSVRLGPSKHGSQLGPSALCARTLEAFQQAAAGQLGSTGQCHVSTQGALGNPGLPRYAILANKLLGQISGTLTVSMLSNSPCYPHVLPLCFEKVL